MLLFQSLPEFTGILICLSVEGGLPMGEACVVQEDFIEKNSRVFNSLTQNID